MSTLLDNLYSSGMADLSTFQGLGNVIEKQELEEIEAETNVERKRKKIAEAAERKRERLGVLSKEEDQYDHLGKGYTTVGDDIYSNKNKIYNTMTDDEYQQYTSDTLGDDSFYTSESGPLKGQLVQAVWGQDELGNKDGTWTERKVEDDETKRRAYAFGLKGDEPGIKTGLARGDMESSVARYVKDMVPGYGWEPGAKGVDTNKNYLDALGAYDKMTEWEAITHGRQKALEDRKYLRGKESGVIGKTDVGSGGSEYYNTAEGVFGDTSSSGIEADTDYSDKIPEYEESRADDKWANKSAQSRLDKSVEGLRELKLEDRGRVENMVDAIQYGLGRKAAGIGDWVVDAGLRLGKDIVGSRTGMTEEDMNKKLSESLKGTMIEEFIDEKGDFVGLDDYKTAVEYGYDDSRTKEVMKDVGDAWSEKNWTKLGGAILGGAVTAGPEFFFESAGELATGAVGKLGLVLNIGDYNNQILEDRAKITGEVADAEGRAYALTGAIGMGLINKLGADEILGNTNIVKQALGAVAMSGSRETTIGAAKVLTGKLLKAGLVVGGKGAYEGTEEIFQEMMSVVGEKYGTKAQDEILSDETGQRLAQAFAGGFGGGATPGAAKEAAGLLKTGARLGAEKFDQGIADRKTNEELAKVAAESTDEGLFNAVNNSGSRIQDNFANVNAFELQTEEIDSNIETIDSSMNEMSASIDELNKRHIVQGLTEEESEGRLGELRTRIFDSGMIKMRMMQAKMLNISKANLEANPTDEAQAEYDRQSVIFGAKDVGFEEVKRVFHSKSKNLLNPTEKDFLEAKYRIMEDSYEQVTKEEKLLEELNEDPTSPKSVEIQNRINKIKSEEEVSLEKLHGTNRVPGVSQYISLIEDESFDAPIKTEFANRAISFVETQDKKLEEWNIAEQKFTELISEKLGGLKNVPKAFGGTWTKPWTAEQKAVINGDDAKVEIGVATLDGKPQVFHSGSRKIHNTIKLESQAMKGLRKIAEQALGITPEVEVEVEVEVTPETGVETEVTVGTMPESFTGSKAEFEYINIVNSIKAKADKDNKKLDAINKAFAIMKECR